MVIKFRFTLHQYNDDASNAKDRKWFDYSSNAHAENLHALLSGIDKLKLKATESVRFQFDPAVEQSFAEEVEQNLEMADKYRVTLTIGERPNTASIMLVEKI